MTAPATAPDRPSPASRRPEYALWKQIRQRCENPRAAGYAGCGGRGVTVCDRWRGPGGFENFFADVGPQPFEGAGLRRLDPGGHFEPGNVAWGDTRPGRLLIHEGRTMSVAAWAEELGVRATTLRARLFDGWAVGDVLDRRVGERLLCCLGRRGAGRRRNGPLPE